jgi:hypothetical protein
MTFASGYQALLGSIACYVNVGRYWTDYSGEPMPNDDGDSLRRAFRSAARDNCQSIHQAVARTR